LLANETKRLYSFVKEFLTKRWLCDGDTNQTEQPPRDLCRQDFQGRVPSGPMCHPHCRQTPPLVLQPLLPLLEQANQALGRLDGLASILPDPSLFIYLYVRKEAVLSSQIEGTQSSFSDLMLFESAEAPSVPLEDVQEVSNYVAAMNHGLRRLRGDFPLSLRLIREIHKILLSKGRGSQKRPGEFRESQNWIGGTRPGNAAFVPPPPEKMTECLDALEKFLHREKEDLPVLVKAALVPVQFETIHPFLDGNGRLGRLLITFLLCVAGAIREPHSLPQSSISRPTGRNTMNSSTVSVVTEIGRLGSNFSNRRQRNCPAGSDTSKGDTHAHRRRSAQD